MDFQLSDVEADGHVGVLHAQFALGERSREQKEHEVLVRVLQGEESVEEVHLYRVLAMVFQRVDEIGCQLINLSFLREFLLQIDGGNFLNIFAGELLFFF